MIGNNPANKELKKKIEKGNMTIDAKTEAIHEHIYKPVNKTNPRTQMIRKSDMWVKRIKENMTKRNNEIPNKGLHEMQCTRLEKKHECPAWGTKCAKYGKPDTLHGSAGARN